MSGYDAPDTSTSSPTPSLLDATGQVDRDLAGGRADRDAGMALAESNAAPEWRERARQTVDALAALGVPFTADDVIEVVGLPDTGSPNAVGALFAGAARRGAIVRAGDAQATRRARHAGRVTVWVGAA